MRIPLLHNEGNAATAGIFRVLSGGQTCGQTGAQNTEGNAKSRILKVARPATLALEPGSRAATSAWQTSTDPAHFNYWRREVEAYATGFAAAAFADAGIRTPELLDVVTREDGCVELWLEDVEGRSGFEMSPGRLGRFGYELGVGQARWAERVPCADEVPWLSRRWLAQYLGHGPGSNVEINDAEWDDPATHAWSRETRHALRALWESRFQVLAAVEALPRTLCHLDCWPANVLEDVNGTSVLLDWPFVGDGAIGEDPANLIVDSVTDGLMDIALLPEIVDEVSEGYIRGLADGGWIGRSGGIGHSGSIAQSGLTGADGVRQAIATCAVAKYSWLGAMVIAATVRAGDGKSTNSYNQDDSAAESFVRIKPLADLLAQWAGSVVR